MESFAAQLVGRIRVLGLAGLEYCAHIKRRYDNACTLQDPAASRSVTDAPAPAGSKGAPACGSAVPAARVTRQSCSQAVRRVTPDGIKEPQEPAPGPAPVPDSSSSVPTASAPELQTQELYIHKSLSS